MLKRGIYTLIRGVEFVNYKLHRMVSSIFPRRWKRVGFCLKCGKCCETPHLIIPFYIYKMKPIFYLYLTYNRVINKFYYVKYHEELHQAEFICGNFDPDTRLCRDYHNRPIFCRNYPSIDTWFRRPDFIEGCGYRPVNRETERISLKFIKEDGLLTEEEREKLKKYIEENGEENGDKC